MNKNPRRYICTKIVTVEGMEFLGSISGYRIKFEDGRTQWMHPEEFKASYRPLESNDEKQRPADQGEQRK